ncbi:chorismate mutase [Streptomyces himastatinicus]|uniref:chorismate mutase n=1 Tax=Streptomyces himastatinicus TaxID=998084 RepID=UPI0001B4EBA6|nr:chorismate mutase [Streptomyces himastatinicus]
MRPTDALRHILIAATAAAVLAGGAGGAVAAPVAPSHGQLRPLAGLSADRLLVADQVAAAKWGTDSPIDDPAREKEVLDAVAEQAEEAGASPGATVRIFRDQIEASKVVQRGLYRKWQADPSSAPTERPDLAKIRLEINRINGELVHAIADSATARTAPSCPGLLLARALATGHEKRLDGLHAVALTRALPSVCETAP